MVERVTFQPPETGMMPPEKPAEQTPPPEKLPDGLPENIRKSYADMRAEVTRLQQENAKLKPAETQVSDQKPTTPPGSDDADTDDQSKPTSQDDAAKKVTDAAGFNVAPFQAEYDTTGDVSEDSRTKIADSLKSILGPDARKIVDDFIESKKVVHQNDTQMYMSAAGGEESYRAMTLWASQNLPREQVEVFNKQVTSGDRHATLFAIDSLKAKYEAANGRTPSLFKGTASAPGGVKPFTSTYEMTQAMRDPRYSTDEAYRNSVRDRLAVSQF